MKKDMKLKFAFAVRVFTNLTGGAIEHEHAEEIHMIGRITGHKVLGRPPIKARAKMKPRFFAVNMKEVA